MKAKTFEMKQRNDKLNILWIFQTAPHNRINRVHGFSVVPLKKRDNRLYKLCKITDVFLLAYIRNISNFELSFCSHALDLGCIFLNAVRSDDDLDIAAADEA